MIATQVPTITGVSGNASGRVVAPAANAVIATLNSNVGLLFEVICIVGFDAGAPVAATDGNNMNLRINGGAPTFTLPAIVALVSMPPYRLLVANPDTTGVNAVNFTIQAIGAGTAGVGYLASIVATRIR